MYSWFFVSTIRIPFIWYISQPFFCYFLFILDRCDKDYNIFGTDVGIYNNMVEDVQDTYLNGDYLGLKSSMKTLNEFSSDRFGFFSNFEFGGLSSSTTIDGRASVGFFDRIINPDGTLGMVKRNGAAIRRSMSHESAHINNLFVIVDGHGPGSEIGRFFYKGGKLEVLGINHGKVGYVEPIRNAGKLHIGIYILEKSRPGTIIAWQQFGLKKWFYLIPRRF